MRLSEDIVHHILATSWAGHRLTINARIELCGFALVSHDWLRPSQRQLYKVPQLDDHEQCHWLVRTLEENPGLVPLVCGLEFCPERRIQQKKQHGVMPWRCAFRLLEMTRLKSLVLGHEFAKEAETYLHKIAHPETIVSLRISNFALSAEIPALTWDERLSRMFPALQELTLKNATLRIDDTRCSIEDKFDTASGESTITALSLDGCTLVPGYDSIPALFQSPLSWSQLQILDVGWCVHEEHVLESFISLLRLVSPTLEYLAFFVDDITLLDLHLVLTDDIPLFPRLRTIKSTPSIICETFRPLLYNVTSFDLESYLFTNAILEMANKIKKKKETLLPNLRFITFDGDSLRPPQNANAILLFDPADEFAIEPNVAVYKLYDICFDLGVTLD